jgi:sulfotransferase family protein
MSTSLTLTQQEKTRVDWLDIPPVFIVGCARSGTTLLRLMLSAHPRISISSEGAYIYHLRPKLASYGDLSDPKRLEALYRDILPFLEAEKFLSPPAFEQFLDWARQFGTEPRSIMTFYGTWEARVTGKEALAWWGDNAPYHVYHIPYFKRLFPCSKFILMIRDPRDVYASLQAAWPGETAESLAMLWERCLLDGLLAASCLGDSTVKQVRYEDLVTHPRAQLEEICEFLDVEYTDAMLRFHEIEAARNLSSLDHHRNVVKPVFTSSVGKYRQILSREESDALRSRLYGPMRLLDYISYEEYEKTSRNALSKVHRRRSTMFGSSRHEPVNSSSRIMRHERTWRNWIDVPPVFVVGPGRSGTTLLRMMLSAHPNIFVSSEGAYVCPLRCKISSHGDLRDIQNLDRLRIELLPWLEAVNYLSPPGIDELAAWVDRFGCDERALITFFGTWEARVLGKGDLAWWGDNEPSHVFNIPYFKSLFPNCKFILMIRDPRDVYASFQAAWPRFRTAETSALLWERCLLHGLLAASCLGDSTVKQVRYEDLVTHPKEQLEEICEFLDVEYTDAMLKFHEIEAARNLSSVDHHRNIVKPVFTSSVGKYRQILTREEIATIEQQLCTPMSYFGYISYEEFEEMSMAVQCC